MWAHPHEQLHRHWLKTLLKQWEAADAVPTMTFLTHLCPVCFFNLRDSYIFIYQIGWKTKCSSYVEQYITAAKPLPRLTSILFKSYHWHTRLWSTWEINKGYIDTLRIASINMQVFDMRCSWCNIIVCFTAWELEFLCTWLLLVWLDRYVSLTNSPAQTNMIFSVIIRCWHIGWFRRISHLELHSETILYLLCPLMWEYEGQTSSGNNGRAFHGDEVMQYTVTNKSGIWQKGQGWGKLTKHF